MAAQLVGDVEFDGDIVAASSTSDITAGTSGNVTAGVDGNFKYTGSKTFYYTVPAAACTDYYSNVGDNISRTYGYAYIHSGEAPYAGLLLCHAKLPEGVTVTQVDCGVRDSDSSGYVKFYMYRMSMSGSLYSMAYAATSSSGTPGDTTISDTSIAYPTVDNYSYSYFIRVQMYPSQTGSSNMRFNQCRVTYTMQDVKP